MRAILVTPPGAGARVADVPIPARRRGQVRVGVVEVGVCGTDRDIASGAYGRAPEGRPDLILGHENLGRVLESEAGPGVPAEGDWVVATVRRGCGRCPCCAVGRSDACESGAFTERGISGADGYWAEQYVEDPTNLVKIPPEIRGTAVLLEPLSVVEKAIRVGLADRYARRPPNAPEHPLRALVAGSGAVGMLAALALRIRGASVTVIDRHPGDTPAAQRLATAGATHRVWEDLAGAGPSMVFDLIVEATGSAVLAFDLGDRLAPNGCLVLTGIPPASEAPAPERVAAWARGLVLANRAVVGSVNASHVDFEAGVADLVAFDRRWSGLAASLRTSVHPLSEAPRVVAQRAPGEIKTVLSVAGPTG
ncbi:MAG TPA: alcohol dehydrogenase catalytic domain-containing protein [Thermoplasmata archaeon]|nr:alcohol dehydrogenase catalytic domain-containing protein [Thermoplasmata archaeon]